MTRVFLVRHASHGLLGHVLAGRMPGVPLSERGHAEARSLADQFERCAGIAAVLSSPRQRCRETAQPLAERLGLPVELHDALDEIDCGDWTGRRFETLADDPRWHAWNRERAGAAAPGGEAAAEVVARVLALFETLAAEAAGAAILVTHADVIKSAVLSLLRASLDAHDRLDIEPASITTLDLWRGGGKLVGSNKTVTP